jgi:hypothetical protein
VKSLATSVAVVHRRGFVATTTIVLKAELPTTNVRHFPMLAERRPAYGPPLRLPG